MKMPKSHTGKIKHKDMTSLLRSVGTKDPHAHPTHQAANVKHGMPLGLAPKDEAGGPVADEGDAC